VGQNEKVTNRDIVLENHNSQLRRVDEIHPWYDSLQCPILFPNADDRYSIYLRQVDPLTRLSLPTNLTVSAINFYAYRTMYTQLYFGKSTLLTTCKFLPAACSKVQCGKGLKSIIKVIKVLPKSNMSQIYFLQ
jgi:hypothetical protein